MAGGSDVLQEVRITLDDLGYREPLPPHGLPLVHHLLDDLVSATAELKDVREKLSHCKKVSGRWRGLSVISGCI